ncbi:hypothetical protein ES703_86210 [subsurface metagenome]
MGEKLKIKFKVSVFSKYGSLVDKFTVEAATKKEAEGFIEKRIKLMGNVNYKIT